MLFRSAALSIARFGNSITVEAYWRTPKPVMVDTNAITGVVATRDGVISSMEFTGGTAAWKVGDAVAQGELLITALMMPRNEETAPFLSHGMGRVPLKIYYPTCMRVLV